MNPLYEKLITSFLDKASIERDAENMLNILRGAYPNCKLPVLKTVKRFLNGETHKPQKPLLGFLAAFVLEKTEEEVESVYQSDNFGDFFQIFAEQMKDAIGENTPPNEVGVLLEQSHQEIKKLRRRVNILKIVLGITLLLSILTFVIYRFINKKTTSIGVPFPTMIFVKGGTFLMGDTNDDNANTVYKDENPVHQVSIDSFEMSETEITFQLFDQYCDARNIPRKEDLGWGRNNHPVVMVDWHEAVDFCNWLSQLMPTPLEPVYNLEHGKNNIVTKVTTNLKANGFRLPTEAEWEYAASIDIKRGIKYRFGHHSNTVHPDTINFYCGEDLKEDYSTACKTLSVGTRPVKQSGLNKNGLYDMCGNVSEWCQDYFDDNFYQNNKSTINPVKNDTGYFRVIRGGAWNSAPANIRASYRERSPPTCRDEAVGFRVVRRVQK
jgi:formylglycine-generating enzyme required for sulfatase activity